MDFIQNQHLWYQLLSEYFSEQAYIYSEASDNHEALLFDCRKMSVSEGLFEGIRTVFAVVFNQSREVLLVEHPKRGWEICGGHLTFDELKSRDITAGLRREALEESGYSIENPQLSFLVWVHNRTISHNKELQTPYPEHSLMAYYICDLGQKLSDQLYDNIQSADFFSLKVARSKVKPRNRAILDAIIATK